MADMTEKGTSAVAQTSKLESETKVEDESGKELTAAAALTSLISSAVLSTGESEEHADVTGDKEGNTASDTEFDIPQRYTSSGRKRAVSFPLKVRCQAALCLFVLLDDSHRRFALYSDSL